MLVVLKKNMQTQGTIVCHVVVDVLIVPVLQITNAKAAIQQRTLEY